jgi:ABC-type Na+ transport system ATPase subunit NatA
LKEIATGTRIQKSLLDIVADKLSPREFVDLIIRKEFDLLESKTGLSVENVEKLVSHFNNIEAFEQVLELQYLYYPEDVPHILFRMDDGEYKEIREVSIGQRCTALLIIALISGDFPIIIDQPEESIDIASVFDDIVNKLRNGKDYRQFILTTHNPNIAVTADSDLIHILCGTSSSGEIRVQGAIEDEEVRNEVIQHLEGGEEPYLIRGKKYRILE